MEKIMFLDYSTLQIVWWLVFGLVLAAFTLMDGFDLGTASMLPWVPKNDVEKRILLNTVGPVWESNQVWLVVFGGLAFGIYPRVYGMAFSGFYIAMFLVLVTLILRPVGFKFRSKVQNKYWRNVWDACLYIGGTAGPILFGVTLGNILLGVPFYYDETMRGFYEGGFFGLLRPFPLLVGIMALALCWMQAGLYLNIKTEGTLQERIRTVTIFSSLALALLFIIGGIWISLVPGFILTADNHVLYEMSGWLNNYNLYPALWLLPLTTLLSIAIAVGLVFYNKRPGYAFLAGSVATTGIIVTYGCTLFPFLLPSDRYPQSSLTAWNASASHISLFISFLFAMIFIPLIIYYVSWVFRMMRGKVNAAYVMAEDSSY